MKRCVRPVRESVIQHVDSSTIRALLSENGGWWLAVIGGFTCVSIRNVSVERA